jgi:tripartite-type tricarboxylate transporter receptor subunit TctC
MGRYLKQTVIIENKSGAGGGIGMAQVAKSKPDGYTVLMALSSIVVLPEADKILQRNPMFQLDQLKPIARFTADPTVLVVRAESPWKTYAEFLAYVKANPAKISFGSSGNYGTMHVPMEQIKAGKLRALAHWGDGRLSSLPDVPSLKELGVPIAYAQWSGLFVPANTPAPVVEKLRQAAKFAAQDARANQALTAAGTSFMFQDSPEFERYVTGDAKEMAKLVQRIGKVD